MNEISVEKVALILFEKDLIIQNLKEQVAALQSQAKEKTSKAVMAEGSNKND